MEILRSIEGTRSALSWRRRNRQVGLVTGKPGLHNGHLSLLKACQTATDLTVLGINHNPLLPRVGPAGLEDGEIDLDLDKDALLAEQLGVDYLFAPRAQEMFPNGGDLTRLALPPLAARLLEPGQRGYFEAAATALLKILNVVQPDVLFLGEKDYQLLLLMRTVLADLDVNVQLRSCPTVRDSDDTAFARGLARLKEPERRQASILHQTLQDISHALHDGARNYEGLEQTARVALRGGGYNVHYVSIREESDLTSPHAHSTSLRILACADLGGARLTDNIRVAL